jgi:hypothetical protein
VTIPSPLLLQANQVIERAIQSNGRQKPNNRIQPTGYSVLRPLPSAGNAERSAFRVVETDRHMVYSQP